MKSWQVIIIFFGYLFKDLIKHFKLTDLSSEIYNYIKKHSSLYGLKTFGYFMLPSELRVRARVNEKGYIDRDFVNNYSRSNNISGTLYNSDSLQDALIDHFEYKLEHLLKWEDRNSMWFSLEARVPFLDHRLVEKTIASDWRNIIYKGMTKKILREAMKGIVPEKIRLRKDKMGFGTPHDEWLHTPKFNKKIIEEILASGNYLTSGLVNSEKTLQLYEAHCRGKINISKEIWKWIHLEMWHREFFN